MSPEKLLAELMPNDANYRVVSRKPLGGGCISDAECVTIQEDRSSQRVLFWKKNAAPFIENFRCEANGLQHLAEFGRIRTPKVLCVGIAGGQSHLLLEFIDRTTKGTNYQQFGDALAQHHHASAGNQIGWEVDNFLGSTVQHNRWDGDADSWPEFVAQRRIAPQVRMASDSNLIDTSLKNQLQRVIDQMDQWLIGRENRTSLLHGDLWSGNFWSDPGGEPVWIDPAVYRGCREAEFGMIELFGGCAASFYEAYHARYPLPDGWKRRVDVYVLYHLLNHLNLFGASYLQSCRDRAAAILRAT
ncbi:fructosamine-3-kinase [Rhodopirellula rubra]|uniref:Fructosamine-3-kinase n=1 Tax=Aporhodopirellula rubra TaxID=980271 RepID=A0A7W5DW99_9BACT|nr:fructosamine kinase family protein [Aporhodopirellula rubra]MBB3205347.1 fructosamine-3-kinase [Aporhodopirellula rubra]